MKIYIAIIGALIVGNSIAHAACVSNNDGREVCSGSNNGSDARPSKIVDVTMIKFDPNRHTDPSYKVVADYRSKTGGFPSQDDYYVPLIVDPRVNSTVSQLDCAGVSFQKWLGALVGVQRGQQVAVSFSASYQGAFGSSQVIGDSQSVASGAENLDPNNKLASQCSVNLTSRSSLKYIRFGGAAGLSRFGTADRYQITVKTTIAEAAQLNAVATLTSLLNKALKVAAVATGAKVELPPSFSSYSDVASTVESALQAAINGQFSSGEAFSFDVSGNGSAGVRISLANSSVLRGGVDIYAPRIGSALLDYTGGSKAPSQIIRLRLFDGQTKSALDKLQTDDSLKTFLDDPKPAEKLGLYCRNLRTLTAEALPLSVADAALMRWAILKYKGLFDQTWSKGVSANDECFSAEDAVFVATIFPFTKVGAPIDQKVAVRDLRTRFAASSSRPRVVAAKQIRQISAQLRQLQKLIRQQQRVASLKGSAGNFEAFSPTSAIGSASMEIRNW